MPLAAILETSYWSVGSIDRRRPVCLKCKFVDEYRCSKMAR